MLLPDCSRFWRRGRCGAALAAVLTGAAGLGAAVPVVAQVPAAQVPATAPAPAAKKPAEPVTLRLAYKAGQKDRYRNTGTVSGAGLGGGSATENTTSEEAVASVKEDGSAVVETRIVSYAITFNGMQVPGAPAASSFPVTKTTLNKAGTVTAYKVEGTFPGPSDPKIQEALTFAGSLGLPGKPVSPGESWTLTLPNKLSASGNMSSTVTYVGRETLDNKPADRVREVWTLDLPSDKGGGQIKGDLTLYLEPDTGRKLKTVGTITGLPSDMFGPLTISVVQTLAPATADAATPKKDEPATKKAPKP